MTHITMRRAAFLGAALVLALGAAACSPDGASDGTTAIAGPGATGNRATVNPPPDGLAGYDQATTGTSFEIDGVQWSFLYLVDARGHLSTQISRNGVRFFEVAGDLADAIPGQPVPVRAFDENGLEAFSEQVYLGSGVAGPDAVASPRVGRPPRVMAADFPCEDQLAAFAAASTFLGWELAKRRLAPLAPNRLQAAVASMAYATWDLFKCLRREGFFGDGVTRR